MHGVLPYLEGYDAKKRPALIVSTEGLTANYRVLWAMMMTTAKGSTLAEDIKIKDLESIGLPEDCVIRPSRLFTLSTELMDRKLGSLKAAERNAVIAFIKRHIP